MLSPKHVQVQGGSDQKIINLKMSQKFLPFSWHYTTSPPVLIFQYLRVWRGKECGWCGYKQELTLLLQTVEDISNTKLKERTYIPDVSKHYQNSQKTCHGSTELWIREVLVKWRKKSMFHYRCHVTWRIVERCTSDGNVLHNFTFPHSSWTPLLQQSSLLTFWLLYPVAFVCCNMNEYSTCTKSH